jgi:hypothetical protein
MKILIAAILAVLTLASLAHGAPPFYPDLKKTPGVADPAATVARLCTPNYTARVRNVTEAMKRQVFAEYGITRDFGSYEVDHLISLELGGANDVRNLWPQPYCPLDQGGVTCFGAREKDHVENYLKREICAGRLTIRQAQDQIVRDWFSVYRTWSRTQKPRSRIKGAPKGTPGAPRQPQAK